MQSGSPDSDFLSRLVVAAPCPFLFEDMEKTDNEAIRRCQGCSKNVYHISKMSTKDAENLLAKKEGNICVQFYRRSDGTIITDNCPVGLRRIRDLGITAVQLLVTAFTVLIAASFSLIQPLTKRTQEIRLSFAHYIIENFNQGYHRHEMPTDGTIGPNGGAGEFRPEFAADVARDYYSQTTEDIIMGNFAAAQWDLDQASSYSREAQSWWASEQRKRLQQQ